MMMECESTVGVIVRMNFSHELTTLHLTVVPTVLRARDLSGRRRSCGLNNDVEQGDDVEYDITN